jgi:hypothetical protein
MSVTKSYCRVAKGALVVYDVANMASFDATTGFMQHIRQYIQTRPPM